MTKVNERATKYLKTLPRIEKISDEDSLPEKNVLLFPKDAELFYTNDDVIITNGLGEELDSKQQDLLTFIKITDPLNVRYEETTLLMPKTYAESLDPIPHHISVQAIILSRVTEECKEDVLELIKKTNYNKTPYDRIWIEDTNPVEKLETGKIIFIMNRRVGGWDGSPHRPVIELFGGGGHLPTIWNEKLKKFKQMDPVDAVIKEFREELRYSLAYNEVDILGGFHNLSSNELVILCSVLVPFSKIVEIQKGALDNFQEHTNGIYLGTFRETMKLYLENAEPYAGGEKTKGSNFPSQPILMERILNRLESMG